MVTSIAERRGKTTAPPDEGLMSYDLAHAAELLGIHLFTLRGVIARGHIETRDDGSIAEQELGRFAYQHQFQINFSNDNGPAVIGAVAQFFLRSRQGHLAIRQHCPACLTGAYTQRERARGRLKETRGRR